ncbi:MAG TPA: class I SAM-dependent methyltransferase [Solirubrobacteraceae bacterium]|nr:class I SAM-dependent methyltransferase [Solirubrobacteraceae bacterium]
MAPRQPFLDRDFYSDPRRRARSAVVRALSKPARRLGFDLEIRTFYSPIPDLAFLDDEVFIRRSALPGIEFDVDAQLAFVERELAAFAAEFRPPRSPTSDRTEFYLDNGLYQAGDAELLYAFIRRYRPATVLELGAGFSTLVAAGAVRANRRDGHETRLISCDPYASREAAATVDGLSELRPVAAERIAEAEFGALRENDVLFIDSSHTVRVGGDVVHLLCEAVPRLAPGVLVHVHDIYLPYEYPREWFEQLRWYWAEQYLLQALLVGNPELQVLVGAHALWRERRDQLAHLIPTVAGSQSPLSFWMRTS